MFGLVQGIIVDGFSAIRDDGAKLDREMRERCFICGMSASMLKSESDGFEAHVSRDHNAFKYVFYIDYILSKPVTERTGLESFVIEQYSVGNFSFLPDGDCLRLRNRRRHAKAKTSTDGNGAKRGTKRKMHGRSRDEGGDEYGSKGNENNASNLEGGNSTTRGVSFREGKDGNLAARLDRLEDALEEMRRLLRDSN